MFFTHDNHGSDLTYSRKNRIVIKMALESYKLFREYKLSRKNLFSRTSETLSGIRLQLLQKRKLKKYGKPLRIGKYTIHQQNC